VVVKCTGVVDYRTAPASRRTKIDFLQEVVWRWNVTNDGMNAQAVSE